MEDSINLVNNHVPIYAFTLVLRLFYRLLGLQEKVKIQQELFKSWQDNLLTVKKMFNIGQANEADMHQANVQLQQQQLRLQMAENELQLEKERLITLVGTDLPSKPVSGNLAEEITPLNYQEALERLLQESPELGMAYANVKSDEIMVQREKAEPIPNINVRFSAGRNSGVASITYPGEILRLENGNVYYGHIFSYYCTDLALYFFSI